MIDLLIQDLTWLLVYHLTHGINAPSIGDEIAVYDEDGNLVGSSTYEGGHVAITVWGDDLSTDKKKVLLKVKN